MRILLAQDEAEEALRLLPSLLQGAIRQERFEHAIEIYLLQARALRMMQQKRQAFASLREARHLAEPEGYKGTTNQQIAERLVIAVTTVKRHTSHIFNKLGVENRMLEWRTGCKQ